MNVKLELMLCENKSVLKNNEKKKKCDRACKEQRPLNTHDKSVKGWNGYWQNTVKEELKNHQGKNKKM